MEFYNVLLLIKTICDSVRYSNNEIIYLFLTGFINTKSGHITKIFNSESTYHFTTFYKFIEKAKWSYLKVHQKFSQVIILLFKPKINGLIVDDYINYRSRNKTTVKGGFQYDHSHKANRSQYVWGQNILILAVQVHILGVGLTLPVLLKLVGKGQNKIDLTVDLLKIVHRFFEKSFKDTSAGGKGINGITLMDDNEVIDFNITNQNEDDNHKVVLFTKHDDGTFGMKSMPLGEFKPKGRIAQGIKGIEFIKKNMGYVTGMVICKDDFFTLSAKGNVTVHKFVSLPDHNRYNKSEPITDDVMVRKFFIEE
jgi:DNA gyrase/topoisomerase IV subunit A